MAVRCQVFRLQITSSELRFRITIWELQQAGYSWNIAAWGPDDNG